MKIKFIDHIVLVVKDISETEKFYSSFLGSPAYRDNETIVYQIADTRLFLVLPNAEFVLPDKDKGGLNHIAFGIRDLSELKEVESLLNLASIKHSGICIDKYGNKEFIWFDDPSGIRLEVYCRPVPILNKDN